MEGKKNKARPSNVTEKFDSTKLTVAKITLLRRQMKKRLWSNVRVINLKYGEKETFPVSILKSQVTNEMGRD